MRGGGCEFGGGRFRDHDCAGGVPYRVIYAGGLRGPVPFSACIVAARLLEGAARERTSYGYGIVKIEAVHDS